MNLPGDFQLKEINPSDLESSDAWILDRFNQCLSAYEKAYSEYRFYEMAALYSMILFGAIYVIGISSLLNRAFMESLETNH